MNSFIESIQNYGVAVSFIYILILHWNEFEKCLFKKDNSILDQIEIGLLSASTIYKFGITSTLTIISLSAIIAAYIYSWISNVYIFIFFFFVIMILLGILFLKYCWHNSMLHKKLYIKDPKIKGNSLSENRKVFVYVAKEGEDKYIFKLLPEDLINAKYIYVTKLEIFNNYIEHADLNN